MFTRPEGQRGAQPGRLRLASLLSMLGALAAFAACARQPAVGAPAPADATPADSAAVTVAYECALDAVARAGLFVTEMDPRRGSLTARSSLQVLGAGMPTSNGAPVDFLAVSVGRPKVPAAGPVIGVWANTLVPRYHPPSGGRAESVIWTQGMLSSRAISARRTVLESCAGDTASGSRAGA